MENDTTNRDIIVEMGYDDTIVFENPDYDSAIIGVDTCNRAVYSFEKMVEHLMEKDGMTDEEAIEFIEYNTIRALPYQGERAPIVVYDLIG